MLQVLSAKNVHFSGGVQVSADPTKHCPRSREAALKWYVSSLVLNEKIIRENSCPQKNWVAWAFTLNPQFSYTGSSRWDPLSIFFLKEREAENVLPLLSFSSKKSHIFTHAPLPTPFLFTHFDLTLPGAIQHSKTDDKTTPYMCCDSRLRCFSPEPNI